MILSIFLVILAYLMGSICSAVIVCKSCSLPDPRLEGSKNPGATNVLRIAGKKYASLVLFADLLKGTIPVLIAKIFEANPEVIAFVALAAVIGHMYPVFFDFKGGKGVATAIGALLGFQFIVGIMVIATWLIVARFSRYSSLASISAICLAPFYSLLIIGRIDIFPPIFFMALFILIKHRNNIGRLIDGTEPKIKLKQKSVLEVVMDDEPANVIFTAPEAEEKVEIVEAVVKEAKEPAPKKATKAPAVKTSVAKKPAAKKTPAKTTDETAKKAKPAKKPAAKKPAVKPPKE